MKRLRDAIKAQTDYTIAVSILELQKLVSIMLNPIIVFFASKNIFRKRCYCLLF